MDTIIQKLLNLDPGQAAAAENMRLLFRQPISDGWLLIWVLIFLGLAFWSYWKLPRRIGKGARTVMAVFRFCIFVILLILLMRPVLQLTVIGEIRRLLVIAVDVSGSGQIADIRVRDDDRKRAAIAAGELDPKRGLDQPLRSNVENRARIDVVRDVFRNEKLALLETMRERFDLAFFTFGDNVSEVSAPTEESPFLAETAADAKRTVIGDAVREILGRKRGQPLAGIFLVTDGANNAGSPPMNAATRAAEDEVPLYIYGTGITKPRDIIVADIFAPEIAAIDDKVALSVRIRAQDMAGKQATLTLKLDNETVATENLDFDENEELTIPLEFTPDTVGDYVLTASVAPRQDEVIRENNTADTNLQVIDSQFRVLLVEETPRWEFRYLEAILHRDRRIDLDIFLSSADETLTIGDDSPYLANLPQTRDELFAYDIIIIGDVNARSWGTGQLENMSEWVSQFGGGLILLSGKANNPWTYLNTPLAEVLPVEFEARFGTSVKLGITDQPVEFELTPAGQQNPMLQLAPTGEQNLEIWKSLPPIYWAAPVTRAKPTAEVLMIDNSPLRETRFGKMPVIALQPFGLGQALYIGTDNMWRWRRVEQANQYTTIWSQIIQRMALSRLLNASSLSNLKLERDDYVAGDRITMFARMFKPGYRPLTDPEVRAELTIEPLDGAPADSEGTATPVVFRPSGDQDGLYKAEVIATQPGIYQVALKNDPEVMVRTRVIEPRFELGETAMNAQLLRDMAAATGGRFYREENLHELVPDIDAEAEKVETPVDIEIWSSPLFFLLVVGLFTVEWIIRKLTGLK